MKKPVVIHIITRLEPGGSSRNTVDSCAAQAADYNVVLLAGPHKDSGQLLKLLPPQVGYIEVKSLQREISAVRDFRAFRELKDEISRLKPDIVHTHTSKAGALGRLAAAMANLRAEKPAVIIHTPHGHLLYGYYGPLRTFIFRLAEIFLSNFTDYFIALTPGEMRESAGAGIGRPDQWTVIHSGVDFAAVLRHPGHNEQYQQVDFAAVLRHPGHNEQYQQVDFAAVLRRPGHEGRSQQADFSPPAVPEKKRGLGIAPDEIAVGTVARLQPVKGVEYLIRAAALLKARLPAQKLRFVVIGGGELEAPLRALAAALGVRDRVIFTGFRADAAALAAALDIYVQPSLNEAMGRAPLEAQALGVPAVVSAVCGLPAVIKEGETGYSVKPGDPGALAAAIEKLALSAELRGRMGEAAKAWALSKDETGFTRFGPESMNIRLKNFYNKVIGKKYG